MRLFHVTLAFAVLFATFSAHGGQPVGSPPPNSQPDSLISKEAADSTRDTMARLRFAPMWVPPESHFPPASKPEAALPVPSAAYAMIWQPRWQEEIGLSAEQKKSLLAINAKAVAEAKDHAEQFKKLSPEEQRAQVKTWAGKPSPWSQQRDNEIRRQIEAVLNPRQLQTLKDFSFSRYAIGLLYDAKIRQDVGFGQEQEARLRQIAKERLARFQKVSMERAEKLSAMLTPEQQAALPDVVKLQGPTSAVLSIAWELGFDLDNFLAHYPMLAEAPVRERLGLSAEQEKQLHALMADSAARKEKVRQERLLGKEQPSMPHSNAETDEKKQVEAILTPQQLATLGEINFRRQAALAIGYPEKRKTIDVTVEQAAEFQRLDNETHERLYRIDREMLGQVLDILTPRQQEELRGEIDRRGW